MFERNKGSERQGARLFSHAVPHQSTAYPGHWKARRLAKDVFHFLLRQHDQRFIPRAKWTGPPSPGDVLTHQQAAGGLSGFPWQWVGWGRSAKKATEGRNAA